MDTACKNSLLYVLQLSELRTTTELDILCWVVSYLRWRATSGVQELISASSLATLEKSISLLVRKFKNIIFTNSVGRNIGFRLTPHLVTYSRFWSFALPVEFTRDLNTDIPTLESWRCDCLRGIIEQFWKNFSRRLYKDIEHSALLAHYNGMNLPLNA